MFKQNAAVRSPTGRAKGEWSLGRMGYLGIAPGV
jgi:hypothetical protein